MVTKTGEAGWPTTRLTFLHHPLASRLGNSTCCVSALTKESSQRSRHHHRSSRRAPSMWRINLRSQPSRPSPPFDPIVEAWLDSLPPPVVKPSSRELRQWRLTNYHGLGWSVFVICLVLRAASLAVALSVTGIIASVIAGRHGPFNAIDRLVPIVVVVRFCLPTSTSFRCI